MKDEQSEGRQPQEAPAAAPPEKDFLSKVKPAGPKEDKPPRPKLTRREIVLLCAAGALVLALLAMFLLALFNMNRSPLQVINAQVKGDPSLTATELAALVGMDAEGRRHAAAYTIDGGVAFALVEDGSSGYRMASSVSTISGAGGDANLWVATMLSNGREYLVAGLIQDGEATRVTVNGQPATVVDSGNLRCWFYLGEGNIVISSSSISYE